MLAGLMRKDAALAVAMIVGLLALPAASARAGTYDVVACKAPGADGINKSWALETYNTSGKAAPDSSAFVTYAGPTTCGPTNGLGFGAVVPAATQPKRTVKADDGAAWTFHAPAGTTVRRVKVWRYTAAAVSTDDTTTAVSEAGVWTVVARAGDSSGGSRILAGENCPGTMPGLDPPYCRTGEAAFDATKGVTYDDINTPVVSWGLQCTGVSTTLCFTSGTRAGSSNAGLELRGAVVTIDDLVAPELQLAGGVDGWQQPASARELVASDSAGIRSARILVDGVERVAQRYDCDYRLVSPCPVAPTLPLDLAGVADGRHTVTLIAEDAASNVSRIDRTLDLDGTAPVITEVPVSGRTITGLVSDASSGVAGGTIEIRGKRDAPFLALPTTLRGGKLVATVPKSVKGSYGIRVSATDNAGNAMASLVTSMSLSTRIGTGHAHKVRDARATVGYGRAVTVLGRLTSTDGVPVPGQPIVLNGIQHRTGATSSQVATATTDADGRFSVTLPTGPSQGLTVVYPGAAGMLTRTREVALRVPASATIRASKARLSGAGSVRFSGRLRMLGTSLPPGGKIVDLQASQNGRWTTVDAVRAGGRDGAWHAVAHFRGNPGRFPIRLRIRREALFPYELGYSASVVVTVR